MLKVQRGKPVSKQESGERTPTAEFASRSLGQAAAQSPAPLFAQLFVKKKSDLITGRSFSGRIPFGELHRLWRVCAFNLVSLSIDREDDFVANCDVASFNQRTVSEAPLFAAQLT